MENYNDSQKLDLILELLQKQESRAKWKIVWTFIWIFFLVILPMYLSYKMFASFDFSSMMSGFQEVKDAAPGINLKGVDLSEALKLLQQ